MKPFRVLALPALGAILAALAPGCGDPSSSAPIVKPKDDLWEATIGVLQQRQFEGFEEMDKEEGKVVTRWRFKPSIHAFEGHRHQAEVSIVPCDPPVDPKSGEKWYYVQVEVEVERNEDIGNPMVYSEASWKGIGRDSEEEMLILRSIEMAVKDPSEYGPSEEIRRIWEKQEQYDKEIADLKAQEERAAQRLRELDAEGAALETRKDQDADPGESGTKE
mgnify:CR=1 FL=1